jgi:beta-phosphoglucomutase-like phosphatase (HAD superfamily)
LLVAGDAAQRAAAALEQRPDTVVLEDSPPGAVGALHAGLRLLRFGKAADAPRPLYLRSPDVKLPQTRLKGSRARI